VSLEERFNYPAYYNNRELSWLAFNERVLQEAMDKRNPLLERIKFLAIFSSNLDEFFMVRVAGLKDQVKVGYMKPENKAGMTPKEQLSVISEKAHVLVHMQDEIFQKNILSALKQEDIHILKISDLSSQQKNDLEHFFDEQIFPVLTPMAIDAYRPFPLLLNKSINLAVSLVNELECDHNPQLALVQVPSVLKRFIEIPDDKSSFVLLEDIITYFVDKLFTGYKVVSVTQFRITRNADLTIHEEGARDLLHQIEKELKKRKWGAAVRLEIKAERPDKEILGYLLDVFYF
jgi:polyphosphate kinase